MVDIVPAYTTPIGHIADVIEEQNVFLPIVAYESIVLSGVATQFLVVLGDAYTRVTRLVIDGVETLFTFDAADKAIVWGTSLTATARIEITLSPALTYRLLSGSLPPGLTLDTGTGQIVGTVGNILAQTDYRFTARISNGAHVRDRVFVLSAIPRDYPATFVQATLGALTQEDAIGLSYKDLGTLKVGQVFAYSLDIIDRDGVIPPLSVTPIAGLPADTGRWGGLPLGLDLDGTLVTGEIDPLACPGRYYFSIGIDDPIAPSSAIFSLVVSSDVVGEAALAPHVVWDTPAGDLGSIFETEPSHFQVAAHTVATPLTLTYEIAPSSAALPDGVRVDPASGQLIGVFQHVDSDTVYGFILRARAGTVFADRTFSIRVRNRFNSDNVIQLSLRLRAIERKALLPAYAALVPDGLLFRPYDDAFGRRTTAEAYLINGLDGSGNIEAALRGADEPPGLVTRDYHAPFRLILGAHRFGIARDSSGNVVYEVLLRELYDPSTRVGGFAQGDLVIEKRVRYPEATDFAIYPNSVNNIRRDLVNDVGFAVSNDAKRHTIGVSGPEMLPLWMRSQQVAGDDGSIVGFYLGIVIAYLKPGSIAQMTTILRKNSDLILSQGTVYFFDKYYATSRNLVSETTFDGGELTLDRPFTRVDAVYSQYNDNIKYLD